MADDSKPTFFEPGPSDSPLVQSPSKTSPAVVTAPGNIADVESSTVLEDIEAGMYGRFSSRRKKYVKSRAQL